MRAIFAFNMPLKANGIIACGYLVYDILCDFVLAFNSSKVSRRFISVEKRYQGNTSDCYDVHGQHFPVFVDIK